VRQISGRVWAYVGAILGATVSVAANVAHSYVPPDGAPAGWQPQRGAVVGAVFWPVALLVAVEILARVVWPAGRRWVALRYLGLLPVALVAAVVSYRHMQGLLTWYGDDRIASTFGPLAVDGLMVMATGALVATSKTRRQPDGQNDGQDDRQPDGQTDAPNDGQNDGRDGAVATATVTASEPVTDAPEAVTETATPAPSRQSSRPPSRRSKRAGQLARIAARHPGITAAQLAAKAGVSESTARRHLRAVATANSHHRPGEE
jgi:DNA-binding CsgD family transcriptional regulator